MAFTKAPISRNERMLRIPSGEGRDINFSLLTEIWEAFAERATVCRGYQHGEEYPTWIDWYHAWYDNQFLPAKALIDGGLLARDGRILAEHLNFIGNAVHPGGTSAWLLNFFDFTNGDGYTDEDYDFSVASPEPVFYLVPLERGDRIFAGHLNNLKAWLNKMRYLSPGEENWWPPEGAVVFPEIYEFTI